MELYDKKLTAASAILEGIDHKVDTLVDYITTDLRNYINLEKEKLKHTGYEGDGEASISGFTQEVCDHIDKTIFESGDELVVLEQSWLASLFGDSWQYLQGSSRTSMISASVLLKRCSDIHVPGFDYSGICICATAALESELKRVFFQGLLAYMETHYGIPGQEDADLIYKNWPDALLSIPQYQYRKKHTLMKARTFTMGSLPILFGESRTFSAKPSIQEYQLHQRELMKLRMAEYLTEIVNDNDIKAPYDAFYASIDDSVYSRSSKGCFVWKCEKIRTDYRNKAAHTDILSEQEAAGCYNSIICKPEKTDIYVYNAEVAGVLLELFNIIDGEKLGKILYG